LPFFAVFGAIAITRVEKGNPIPGVAIATALMPALHRRIWSSIVVTNFFLGHVFVFQNCVHLYFYLFIVKYLKYPTTKQLDDKSKQVGKVYYFSIDYRVNTTQHLFCIPLIEEKVPTPD
jgi:hypothetical protein